MLLKQNKIKDVFNPGYKMYNIGEKCYIHLKTWVKSYGDDWNTFVSRFLVPQVSPSLIHMPVNVLFTISHSCQILQKRKMITKQVLKWNSQLNFYQMYLFMNESSVFLASYPNIPL